MYFSPSLVKAGLAKQRRLLVSAILAMGTSMPLML